jgi:hypothetical protein
LLTLLVLQAYMERLVVDVMEKKKEQEDAGDS